MYSVYGLQLNVTKTISPLKIHLKNGEKKTNKKTPQNETRQIFLRICTRGKWVGFTLSAYLAQPPRSRV